MLKYKVDRKSLIKVYLAFKRPVWEYDDIVWDNCSDQSCKLLEDVQIEAGRIITGMRCNSSRSKL